MSVIQKIIVVLGCISVVLIMGSPVKYKTHYGAETRIDISVTSLDILATSGITAALVYAFKPKKQGGKKDDSI